jgi:hypothetical protein
LTEDDWADYTVDVNDFDFDELDFDWDFEEFEEDLGFYEFGEEDYYEWGDEEDCEDTDCEWVEPSDWDATIDGEWEYDPYDYSEYDLELNDDGTYTRPSEEWVEEDWENFDDDSFWAEDNGYTDEGTWTDEYGQEYHNYTYAGDTTNPDDVGYTAMEYTDEWATT